MKTGFFPRKDCLFGVEVPIITAPAQLQGADSAAGITSST